MYLIDLACRPHGNMFCPQALTCCLCLFLNYSFIVEWYGRDDHKYNVHLCLIKLLVDTIIFNCTLQLFTSVILQSLSRIT